VGGFGRRIGPVVKEGRPRQAATSWLISLVTVDLWCALQELMAYSSLKIRGKHTLNIILSYLR
jgi:hypothetical protein